MTLLVVNCVACGIEVKFPDIDLTSKKERDNVGIKMRSTLCEACTILNQNDDYSMDARIDWNKEPYKTLWDNIRKVVDKPW